LPTVYRLSRPITGTVAGSEHRSIITVPADAFISLVGAVENEPDFVAVLWGEQNVRVFVRDFTERTDLETQMASGATVGDMSVPDSRGLGQSAAQGPRFIGGVKVRRFNASGREL